MRQTTSDILAVQEVSQVMLGNRTAGRNDVLRTVVRPTARHFRLTSCPLGLRRAAWCEVELAKNGKRQWGWNWLL